MMMNQEKTLDPEGQKEQRRWQILIAGLKVFAKKGFSATSMKEIAQEAGLSYGLAYHYFASKDELFSSLVEIALDSSIESYRKAAAREGGPELKIRSLVESVLEALEDEISPLFFLIMIQASTMAGLPEAGRKLFEERLGEYERILLPIVEEGQGLGLLRPGPALAHCTYLGAIFHGLAITRAVDPGRPLPDAEGILREIFV